LERKSYFEAQIFYDKHEGSLPEFVKLKTLVHLQSVFRKSLESNQNIDKIFAHFKNEITKENEKDLLNLKLVNHIILFEYQEAHHVSQLLINNFPDQTASNELEELKNGDLIWEALSSYPKQKVQFNENSKIKIIRDKAGLKNIHVVGNNEKFPFIFDTGANLSSISESQAKIMKMNMLDVEIQVGNIIGSKVPAKLAVAEKILIGNMQFENVVFLVFPDDALYISQIDYQINGIIGFPVIAAMKEIHFNKNDIEIPLESRINDSSNLAMEFLTPIINIEIENQEKLPFSFDTGATQSILYNGFYHKNKSFFDTHYQQQDIGLGGAGGNKKIKGYVVSFVPIINNTKVVLDSVDLMIEPFVDADKYFYGNIGQDLISEYETMIINFDKMFVKFQ
jgi:predicted aspartyl protease